MNTHITSKIAISFGIFILSGLALAQQQSDEEVISRYVTGCQRLSEIKNPKENCAWTSQFTVNEIIFNEKSIVVNGEREESGCFRPYTIQDQYVIPRHGIVVKIESDLNYVGNYVTLWCEEGLKCITGKSKSSLSDESHSAKQLGISFGACNASVQKKLAEALKRVTSTQ